MEFILALNVNFDKSQIPSDLLEFFEPAECGKCYVCHIVQVFREVKRVLRDDGTLWLNLGDSYWGGKGETRPTDGKHPVIKPKDLIGIPWMVAFALRADGWYLRSDIVWNKPNPMPESVTDRPTRSHEYVFLLSKKAKYYYDCEAIKEPLSSASILRLSQPNFDNQTGGEKDYQNGTNKNRSARRALVNLKGRAMPPQVTDDPERYSNLTGRNKRDVWTITTVPYKEAHFATFPEKLVEPCLLAGTSAKGCCPKCGAPWKRVVEKKNIPRNELEKDDPRYRPNRYVENKYANEIRKGFECGMYSATSTSGWEPTCKCGETETVPCTVLDPFSGAGTVAVVALKHGRSSVGIELNPKYNDLARQRIAEVQPRLILEDGTWTG